MANVVEVISTIRLMHSRIDVFGLYTGKIGAGEGIRTLDPNLGKVGDGLL